MGAFKIQTDLDLSGFNLLNFCIQSYTDLANVPNLGLGRKLFFTGNSTDKKNLREVIWDGDKWKAAVYLDDIEALTNGEGSLGTRVKALEDMLNVDSAETVVSTWEEIQAFLDNVKEGTDLMTMLDGKLDKTGGVISGTDFRPLAINSSYVANNVGTVRVELRHNNSVKGHFGWDSNYGLHFYNNKSGAYLGIADSDGTPFYAAYGKINPLIHAGNVGDYTAGAANHLNSTEVSGEGSDNILDDIFTKKSGISINIARNLGSSSLFYARDTIVVNYSWGGRYGQQWAIEDTSHKILVRTKNADQTGAAWSDWKTIAFTDSDITGNAATATKLQDDTAYTAWGQTFFENGKPKSIQGGLSDVTYIRFLDGGTNGIYRGSSFASSQNATDISYVATGHYFYINGASAMTITEEGDVRIGEGNITHYKLATIGNALFALGVQSSTPTKPTELVLDNVFSLVSSNSSRYGLHTWIYGNGQSNIQAARLDSVNDTVYAINLNPLGGNVNIASADASTNVFGELKVGSGTMGYINLVGSGVNYLWSEATIHIGLSTVGGRSGDNATLTIKGNEIHSGFRNNAVSLGTSSYRWSDVYSVGGDFSGRVLIGGAKNDGESALQVKGLAKFISKEWHTESTIVNHAGLLLYGRGNGDYIQGMWFYGYDKTPLGHIAYYRGYFYIGNSKDTPWFRINSTESNFNVLTKFNAGALIPTGQTLTIGSVTFRETAAGEVEVDGNLHTTGTLASGGKAEEGTGGTGGASGTIREFTIDPPTDNTSSFKLEHSFNTEKVIVQIFELNGNSGKYEMILTDVEITDANNVTVTFGRKPTEYHKVYVMA